MRPPWQIWLDRRGRLSPLRVGTLAAAAVSACQGDFRRVRHHRMARGRSTISSIAPASGRWCFSGVTLAVTPFRRILRYGNLVDIRRMLGVGAFCYIAAHLSLFIADQMLDLGKVVHEITPSLVSHHRRHGLARTWRRWPRPRPTAWCAGLAACAGGGCIRSVYAIALLALIHYFQQTKADVTVPTFVASLFLWLMAYRVVAWWQGGGELSTLTLLAMSIAVSILTFAGEAIGIGIAFHVSPMRVLDTSPSISTSAYARAGKCSAPGLSSLPSTSLRARWAEALAAAARGCGGVIHGRLRRRAWRLECRLGLEENASRSWLRAATRLSRRHYTGLGERGHLARPDIDLETHIADILGVLEFEDLQRCQC